MHQNNTWIEANGSDTTVIFIHGILSNSETCWRNPKNDAYWPSLVLEDKQFKRPSVFVSGYTADRHAGEFEVVDAAEEVMIYLQSEIDGHVPLSKKKLLFICHSQGGLIARRMLCSYAPEFRDKKIGLVLCASPSLGSNWARWLRFASKIFGSAQGEGLDPRDPRLLDLDRDFRRLLDEKAIPEFFGLSLVETSGVWLRLSKIVSTESASRDFIWRKIPKSTHGEVVKPDNERHLSHVYVRSFALKKGFISVNRVERIPVQSDGAAGRNVDATRSSGEQLALREVPEADFAEELDSKFVGRVNLREDMSGLMERLQQGKGGVYWVHGFGGMGKSFFLRRVYLDVPESVKKALVDFDDRSDRFRAPLKDKPRTEADLFDALACAFGRILDADRFKPYWCATTEIRRQETHRAELERRFDATVERLALALARQDPSDFPQPVLNVPDRFPTAEEQAKERECECLLAVIAAPTVKRALEQMRTIRRVRPEFFDHSAWEGFVSRWIMGVEVSPDDAIKDPGGFLSQRLSQCLNSLLEECNFMLFLDTAEVLSERLDHHLCQFLTSVIQDGARLLAVVGSRWGPDDRRRPESFAGWHQGLRDRLRTVPFDQDFKFRQSDVEELLLRLRRPPPVQSDLPAKVVAHTLGVPMSVSSILRMHDEGNNILSQLEDLTLPDTELAESKATSSIIAETARRFLLHIESRQQDDDALRDVILLTLVEGPWCEQLQEAWWGGKTKRRDRLAQLTTQVEFMDGWSIRLEPVRYFRQHWRTNPHRLLPSVMEKARQLMEDQKGASAEAPDTLYGWLKTFASIVHWIDGEQALQARLQAALLARAHPTISILEENWGGEGIGATPPQLSSEAAQNWLRLKAVERPSFRWGENLSDDVLVFLGAMNVKDWSPIALASWHQVLGIAWGKDLDDSPGKGLKERTKVSLHHLRESMRIREPSRKDHDERIEAYLNSVVALTATQDEPEDANEAIEWLLSQGLLNSPEGGESWLSYGKLLHNVKRYDDSNAAIEKAISLDPNLWGAKNIIAHNYEHQEKWTEAVATLEGILNEHPESDHAWNQLADLYAYPNIAGKPRVRLLRRVFHAQRSNAEFLAFFGRYLLVNCEGKNRSAEVVLERAHSRLKRDNAQYREVTFWLMILKEKGGAFSESTNMGAELLKGEQDASQFNHYAWQTFIHSACLDFGLKCADRALEIDSSSHNVLNTRFAILARLERWDDVGAALEKWLIAVPSGHVCSTWHDHRLIFSWVLRCGRGPWMAQLLRQYSADPEFQKIADVLDLPVTESLSEKVDFPNC